MSVFLVVEVGSAKLEVESLIPRSCIFLFLGFLETINGGRGLKVSAMALTEVDVLRRQSTKNQINGGERHACLR